MNPYYIFLSNNKNIISEMKKKQHLLIVAKKAFINYYHEMLGKPKTTNTSLMLIQDVITDPLSGISELLFIILPQILNYSLIIDVNFLLQLYLFRSGNYM